MTSLTVSTGRPEYRPGTFFNRREFCFTLDGDVFVRYQSFKNAQELKSAIQKRVPSKIDIGPVYNVDPQKRAAYANQGGGFAPQERELVFDIDLTVRSDPLPPECLNLNSNSHNVFITRSVDRITTT